jgi:phage gpG-like protein
MARAVRMEVECDNDAAMRRLEGMKARSMDFSPVFREAKRMLEKANAENFTTGGLPVGGWRPRKGEDGYAWPKLRKTNKLFNSLANLNGPPNVITPSFAQFGTDVEYARFHQYGTPRMPARKIVFDPVGFSADLAEKAARYVNRGKF